MPSLDQFVLVAQEHIGIERYTRQPEEPSLLSTFDQHQHQIELGSIGCELPMTGVYEGVAFDH